MPWHVEVARSQLPGHNRKHVAKTFAPNTGLKQSATSRSLHSAGSGVPLHPGRVAVVAVAVVVVPVVVEVVVVMHGEKMASRTSSAATCN